jgi:hypothetical protein
VTPVGDGIHDIATDNRATGNRFADAVGTGIMRPEHQNKGKDEYADIETAKDLAHVVFPLI